MDVDRVQAGPEHALRHAKAMVRAGSLVRVGLRISPVAEPDSAGCGEASLACLSHAYFRNWPTCDRRRAGYKTAIQITQRFKRNFREVFSLVFNLVRRAGADRMRRRVRTPGRAWRAGAARQAGPGWSAGKTWSARPSRESGCARPAGQAWSGRPSRRTRPPSGKSVRQQRRYRCPGQPELNCRTPSRNATMRGPWRPLIVAAD